jgi:hypothetical protein
MVSLRMLASGQSSVAARVFVHLGQGDPRQHEAEIDGIDVGAARKRARAALAVPIIAQPQQIGVPGLVVASSGVVHVMQSMRLLHEFPPIATLVRPTAAL